MKDTTKGFCLSIECWIGKRASIVEVSITGLEFSLNEIVKGV